jgi:hypothetical protein
MTHLIHFISLSATLFLFVGIILVPVSSEVITSFEGQRGGEAVYATVKSGETVTKFIVLKNISDNVAQVELEASPLKHIDSGAVTVGNAEQNTPSMVSFEVKNLAIQANTTSKIPVTIVVPQDIAQKEYGYGLTISTQTKSDSTIQSKIKTGIKLYIIVEGEKPNVTVTAESLKKFNPTSFSFTTIQKGTAFSRLSGKYTLLKDGKEVRTGEFVRDLVVFDTPITHTIAGISQLFDADELSLTYSIKPLNNQEAQYSSPQNTLAVSFNKANPFGITSNPIVADTASLSLLALVCIYSLVVYKKVAGS